NLEHALEILPVKHLLESQHLWSVSENDAPHLAKDQFQARGKRRFRKPEDPVSHDPRRASLANIEHAKAKDSSARVDSEDANRPSGGRERSDIGFGHAVER